MARVTVEDCLELVDNRFALVILAAERARQIAKGAPALLRCDNKPAAAQAPPPPAVTVAHPLVKDVTEWDIYTGHLEAPEVANVAARVSGLVTEMPFPEGAIVKKQVHVE